MKHFNDVYRGKTVLVTGHTGFKGSWLCVWLIELGAKVIGYGLDPENKEDNFNLCQLADKMVDIRGDIRDEKHLESVFEEYRPEYVFHLAAQPLVRESYLNPVYTYDVNVMGTIRVLECMRKCDTCKVGIFITTDKCYDNKEQIWGYRESDPLGGYDPYSSSKAACELAIDSWRRSYSDKELKGKAIASVRAGNVIGGGDWAKDRIVPDCVRAIEKNEVIHLRNPQAVRPWQHVLEPLRGYLLLGERMTEDKESYNEAWNFGPEAHSIINVGQLVNTFVALYGNGETAQAKQEDGLHEASLLTLDISKAKYKLMWKPILSFEETISYTVQWYKEYKQQKSYEICVKQIKSFMQRVN